MNIDAQSSSKPLKQQKPTTQQQSTDYFTQGYDLPDKQDQLRSKLLSTIPILKTKTYRQSLLTIVSSFTQLQSFSNNLQGKVDNLLHAQQLQFVQSYKSHIHNIREQFQRMKIEIEKLSQKVRYYQNQGQMSMLVKKVYRLEAESSNLYKKIKEKDKKIKDLQLYLKIKQDQIYSMQEKIKSNVKERIDTLNIRLNSNNQKDELDTICRQQRLDTLGRQQASRTLNSDDKNIKSQQLFVFTTQVKKSPANIKYSLKDGKSYIINNNSQKSITLDLTKPQKSTQKLQKSVQKPQKSSQKRQKSQQNTQQYLLKRFSIIEQRLQRENIRLKSKNNKLMHFHTKQLDNQSQIQQFFLNSIQQLKREIMMRKKMNYCTLQQFKKEDKIMLMIKILSNNQILSYLYERIFKKDRIKIKNHQNPINKDQEINKQIYNGKDRDREKNKDKIRDRFMSKDKEMSEYRLPKINFTMNYQYK